MARPVEKADYEKRFQSGRWNFFFLCVLTVINIFILMFDGDEHYISGSSVAIYLVSLGKILCGKMDNSFYVGEWANVEFMSGEFLFGMVAIAAVISLIFLLLWLLSKYHISFMFIGFALILADTVFMFFVYDINFMTICDFGIHIIMMILIGLGIHAGIKLKRIKADEEAFMASVRNTHRDMFR